MDPGGGLDAGRFAKEVAEGLKGMTILSVRCATWD
jgi:hypothetical protein